MPVDDKYQLTGSKIPDYLNLQQYRCEYLKSHNIGAVFLSLNNTPTFQPMAEGVTAASRYIIWNWSWNTSFQNMAEKAT